MRAEPPRRHGSAWRTAAALIGLALLVMAGAAAAQAPRAQASAPFTSCPDR